MNTESARTRGLSSHRLTALCFLVVITFSIYIPVLNQQFAWWDDAKYINLVWKPSLERAWAIATDFDLRISEELYFAPLHLLSLMADQAVANRARPSPEAAKIVNVFFHLANTALVFSFLLITGLGTRSAFLGALIFAVHPLQVGTVAWIAERKNLLATFFSLAGMLVFMRYVSGGTSRNLIGTAVLFAAGLLSKPSAVTFPLILILLFVFFRSDRTRSRETAVFLGALFAVAVFWGLYVLSTERTQHWMVPDLPYRPLLFAGTFWFYVGKIVAPYNLVPVYPRWDVVSQVWWFGGLGCAFLGAGAMVMVFWRRLDSRIQFGLLFFLLNLLLVSGIVPFGYMSHSFVADHFLYFPMIGVALIVAGAVEMVFRRISLSSRAGMLVMIAAYLWIAVLGVLSVKQTLVWRNPASVWEETLKVNPNSIAALNQYGLFLLQQGEHQRALGMFQRIAEILPGFDKAYLNMGHAYHALGDSERADLNYRKAAQLNSHNEDAWFYSGRILWDNGRRDDALKLMEEAVLKNPRSGLLYSQLGMALFRMGNESKALEAFTAAGQVEPLVPDSYVHRATILLMKGNVDQAAELAAHSIKLAPTADGHNVLGSVYAERGDIRRALKEFLAALAISPDREDVRDNVANAWMDLGDYAAAVGFCRDSAAKGQACSPAVLKRILEGSNFRQR